MQFLLGLALGAVLTLAVSLGTIGFALWAIVGFVVGVTAPRFPMLSGTLLGLGAALLLLTLNDIAICSATEDFCGRSNPWPFLIGSLVLIAGGVVFGALTWLRRVHA